MFGAFKAGSSLWEFQVGQRGKKDFFTEDTSVARGGGAVITSSSLRKFEHLLHNCF